MVSRIYHARLNAIILVMQVKMALAKACVDIHVNVTEASERFYAELRRRCSICSCQLSTGNKKLSI